MVSLTITKRDNKVPESYEREILRDLSLKMGTRQSKIWTYGWGTGVCHILSLQWVFFFFFGFPVCSPLHIWHVTIFLPELCPLTLLAKCIITWNLDSSRNMELLNIHSFPALFPGGEDRLRRSVHTSLSPTTDLSSSVYIQMISCRDVDSPMDR